MLDQLRALAPELRAQGVDHMSVFGSFARGDAQAESDLDLVVDIEPGRKFSLIDLAGLRAMLSDTLGRDADVVVRSTLKPQFRERIESEMVPVY